MTSIEQTATTLPRREAPNLDVLARPHGIEIHDLSHSFVDKRVVDGVSFSVEPGEIRALLGPNGAGKTTLLRLVAGLITPRTGEIRIAGLSGHDTDRRLRQAIGLVPSGDRTFYLRISGLENLVFFARLNGLRRREAVRRVLELLDRVGLADAAQKRVGDYSHGMQKRLGVARALLTAPPVLLIDEATHDLDPHGAQSIRDLIAELADAGAAVLWTTQRLDEIRGFARSVTVLQSGQVRFSGSVAELLAETVPRDFVLQLRLPGGGTPPAARVDELLAELGTATAALDGGEGDVAISLEEPGRLGEAVTRLTLAGVDVVSCRQQRSEIEAAFMHVTDSAFTEQGG